MVVSCDPLRADREVSSCLAIPAMVERLPSPAPTTTLSNSTQTRVQQPNITGPGLTDDSGSEAADTAERTLDPRDLGRLAYQLQELANELKDVQSGENGRAHPTAESALIQDTENQASGSAVKMKDNDRYLAIARARYKARRKRVAFFQAEELFGEPAWDILLDLYIAYAEDKPVSVSSACIGSASPPTTGLRWLGVLQSAGLVEREHDPRDQRRVLVRLSQHGIEQMETYFKDALLAEDPLIL